MDSRNSQRAIDRKDRTSLLGVAILGTILAVFLILAWSRCSKPALTDYEGVILDRWAGYSLSEQGDHPYFRLLIERDTRERITVNVDAETYRRAQVGMRVSSRNGAIEVTEAQAKPDK